MTPAQRAQYERDAAEHRAATAKAEAAAAQAKAAQAAAATAQAQVPPPPVYVSAIESGISTFTSAPLRPVGPGRPAWEAAQRPQPPVARQVLNIPTAADFPRAVNAATPPQGIRPGQPDYVEDVRALTTPEAVRNGTYAANRERLLAMSGAPRLDNFGLTPSGVYATADQSASPVPSGHPLASPSDRGLAPASVDGPRAPGTAQAFHGYPSGPASPAMAAKMALNRAARRGGK